MEKGKTTFKVIMRTGIFCFPIKKFQRLTDTGLEGKEFVLFREILQKEY